MAFSGDAAAFRAISAVMVRLPRALTEMDARAWRAVLVTLGLLGSVLLVFLFGRTELGRQAMGGFEAWLDRLGDSPWGLPAAIAVFTLASFIGAPQFVLIAACVVAFGPWLGFLYSWIATVVSAAANFWVGRLAGGYAVERFGGDALNRLSGYVGRNAFSASFIIRNVPSAPFILVNMAFGVSPASFWGFLSGCALGVLPKTALVAIFGKSFMALSRGKDWRAAAVLAAVSGGWLGLMLVARFLLQRRSASAGPKQSLSRSASLPNKEIS